MRIACINCISETALNTIITSFSIVCTICTCIFAYRAKRIKDSVVRSLKIDKFRSYTEEFHNHVLDVTNKIKKLKQNRGGCCNKLILSLNKDFLDFNQYQDIVPQNKRNNIMIVIDTLSPILGKIREATANEDEFNAFERGLRSLDRELMAVVYELSKE